MFNSKVQDHCSAITHKYVRPLSDFDCFRKYCITICMRSWKKDALKF